ncbi:AAA family ATPase [Lachnospira pectinoschiza]|uniref:ATPase AAA-type core domain-containing protein n=1 Tax=Lachnospira pectinoschiza TaxID=28052 RepID=A0A1G9ZR32_9FIRM|nr:ATP-binding protein [Lachnospira pectinoschiza]SDN23545.1 hypothetical protein SAMN05216544_2214 [Lachnospira pectinoschiza]
MLVRISVENFKSFDSREELSMISSSKIREKKEHKVKIKQTSLLRNSVIYGANASGKSNIIRAFALIKATLNGGIPMDAMNHYCRNKKENENRESVFELQFTIDNKFYAYGFSCILSKRIITEEWLFELLQNGVAKELFTRDNNAKVHLGDTVKPSINEENRFKVYADDFAGHDYELFISEMNRGKKYEDNSKLIFFKDVFDWMNRNIIILTPEIGISNSEIFYNKKSLDELSNLIRTFDTGITEVLTKNITMDELNKIIPVELFKDVVNHLQKQIQNSDTNKVQASWRFNDSFISVRKIGNEEPEIRTLVLKHGNSDFDYGEESDGTKRLFDLVDILISHGDDVIFVIDELERSLHPKLTERFLELFMESHANEKVQLLFTTHEDTIMSQSLFRRDEIWFVERDNNNASKIYSLDRFKQRYDKVLSKAYLEGRYGAIPVFKKFTFSQEEK